ncbi:MAG: anhydro-N-acetylmuramic acid kinase [Elusimicrobia bacterium]|nr:MAG: anhydro-N-acetylmuramic acid kinase [Elusimicrobiota bacterium]
MGKIALGLMSGTSADGLSMALVEFTGSKPSIKAYSTRAYSKKLREKILDARSFRAPEIARLDFELGRFYAREALRFLKDRRVSPKRLTAVGTHGQTIAHATGWRFDYTLQIGEPSYLAEALGVPVVSDFRPRDIAAGGLGAPIIPFFDEVVYGGGAPRILQNIGGIANCSFVGKDVPTIGFDTGPGNCLIDLAVRRMSDGAMAFDRGGRIARRGNVDEKFVKTLIVRERFFRKRPPKSLDRSSFSGAFLAQHFRRGTMSDTDVIATVTHFTAATIADAIRRFVIPVAAPKEMIVSGGGAFNDTLMLTLRRLLYPLPIRSIAATGIPVLAKEPVAIALMALRAVERKINHCPRATGASGKRILGKITI